MTRSMVSPLVHQGPDQLYIMLWDHLYIKPLGGLVGWECIKVEKLMEVLMHCRFSNPFVHYRLWVSVIPNLSAPAGQQYLCQNWNY